MLNWLPGLFESQENSDAKSSLLLRPRDAWDSSFEKIKVDE